MNNTIHQWAQKAAHSHQHYQRRRTRSGMLYVQTRISVEQVHPTRQQELLEWVAVWVPRLPKIA